MSLNKKEVIKILVGHFGKEFREEIENSLYISKTRISGDFYINGIGYCIFESEEKAKEEALKAAHRIIYKMPELVGLDFMKKFISLKDEGVIRDLIYFHVEDQLSNFNEREVLKILSNKGIKVRDSNEAFEKLFNLLEEKEFKKIRNKDIFEIFNLYLKFKDLADYLEAEDYVKIDFDKAAEALIKWKGWVFCLSEHNLTYETLDKGMVIFKS